jgi:AraC-like DNA-binding protein
VHQFHQIVGLSPKMVARINRFQAVISAARGRSRLNWGVLGHQLGYADQSHLIREFRDFAGVHPTEFLRTRTPDESHVIIA